MPALSRCESSLTPIHKVILGRFISDRRQQVLQLQQLIAGLLQLCLQAMGTRITHARAVMRKGPSFCCSLTLFYSFSQWRPRASSMRGLSSGRSSSRHTRSWEKGQHAERQDAAATAAGAAPQPSGKQQDCRCWRKGVRRLDLCSVWMLPPPRSPRNLYTLCEVLGRIPSCPCRHFSESGLNTRAHYCSCVGLQTGGSTAGGDAGQELQHPVQQYCQCEVGGGETRPGLPRDWRGQTKVVLWSAMPAKIALITGDAEQSSSSGKVGRRNYELSFRDSAIKTTRCRPKPHR